MAEASTQLLILFTLVTITIVLVKGQAFLEVPPSRNYVGSLIRKGDCLFVSGIERDYQKAGLNCGGKTYQETIGGKCGACGDAYYIFPRPHETGLVYSDNIITYAYTTECTLTAEVRLTGPRKGWMEFRLCHDVNPGADSTTSAPTDLDDCFTDESRHRLLSFSDNTTQTRDVGYQPGIWTATLELPKGITCEHCVLQWKYVAGNDEEFYNCADIAINARDTKPKNILICNDAPNVAEQCPPNPKQSEQKGSYDWPEDSYEDSDEETYYEDVEGYDGDEESDGWDEESDDWNVKGYDGNEWKNKESNELAGVAGPGDKVRIQFGEEVGMLMCKLAAHRTANPLVKKCCRRVCQGDNEEVCTWLYTC